MPLDENKFFRAVTRRICGSLDINAALENTLRFTRRVIPADGIMLGLYDPELHVFRRIASVQDFAISLNDAILPIPEKFWERIQTEWNEEPETHRINDSSEEPPHVREILGMVWPQKMSHIFMDLQLENERLGMLHICAHGKHRYTEEHLHLISQLNEPFAIAMANCLKHEEVLRLKDLLKDDYVYLQHQMRKLSGDTIIGTEFGLKDVMAAVRQVAPLDSPVLLYGETGVGKEVIANAIHYGSPRKNGPFIKVNCGAIPESLLDSELFGHEKGAFTGAMSRKRGRFERAHGGTIFLDEVGELPPPAQIRLLRVLQQKEIERVGGSRTIKVDVRIISATHRNLEERVKTSEFREDLLFRLNVFPILIPPLRQRREDIPALVHHFIERKSMELKIHTIPKISSRAMTDLTGYMWPGNVRELENMVERALIRSRGGIHHNEIRFDIPEIGVTAPDMAELHQQTRQAVSLDEVITRTIEDALKNCNGRIEGPHGAATMLGLHPSTLRGKMKRLSITNNRPSA